jgi:hypothetical protein
MQLLSKIKQKKSFLLIEVVFVILIISVLIYSNNVSYKKDYLTLAINHLLLDIKTCQNLALMDNNFDINDKHYFKKTWQIKFNKSVDAQKVWAYTIFKDLNYDGNININDTIAINRLNQNKLLSGGQSGVIRLDDPRRTKSMTLVEYFGIDEVQFSKSCTRYNSTKIIFDNKGKPYYGYSYKDTKIDKRTDLYEIKDICKISLIKSNKEKSICIEPNTGFSYICN